MRLRHFTDDVALRATVTAPNAATFMAKLAARIGALGSLAGQTLAVALARAGDLFPANAAAIAFFDPFNWSARIVQDLIYSFDDPQERASIVREVIERGTPATFVAESIWQEETARNSKMEALPNPSSSGAQSMASYLVDPSLRALAASRMRAYAQEKSPLFVTNPDQAMRVLGVWASNADEKEVDTYVKEILDHDPYLAFALLRCCLTRSTNLTTGRSGRQPFDQSAYEALEGCVDVAIVYGAFQQLPRDMVPPESDLRMVFEEIYAKKHAPSLGTTVSVP